MRVDVDGIGEMRASLDRLVALVEELLDVTRASAGIPPQPASPSSADREAARAVPRSADGA